MAQDQRPTLALGHGMKHRAGIDLNRLFDHCHASGTDGCALSAVSGGSVIAKPWRTQRQPTLPKRLTLLAQEAVDLGCRSAPEPGDQPGSSPHCMPRRTHPRWFRPPCSLIATREPSWGDSRLHDDLLVAELLTM